MPGILEEIYWVVPRLNLFAIVGLGFAGLAAGSFGQVQEVKNFTAEQVAEGVIVGNGGRPALTQIRRNGLERGHLSRLLPDGRTEDDRYELRFVRGDDTSKDRVRVDHKTPQTEYSIVLASRKIFGMINGAPFIPRADVTGAFLSERAHSIDALLRYKENDSKLKLVGKDKHQGIDVYLLDLTDHEDH